MLHGRHTSLIGVLSLALALSGCDYSSSNSASGNAGSSGSGTAGGTGASSAPPSPNFSSGSGLKGADDAIVASSPGTVAAVIGAAQTVSIAFTSSDGREITGFGVSATLANLPAGWSGPTSFTCASVTRGSSCVLDLTYAPAAIDSGSLAINYVYVDNATVPKTGGTLTVPYTATANNNVAAAVSPTGQINAVGGAGNQAVSVNFITDDGNAATNLMVTTDLTALPSGWTSAAPSLSCAIVSTGSGCRLNLGFAPAAGAGAGTLALNYSYTDDSGASKTGTVNISYSATPTNNVVATASPAGQVIAVQKTGGQPVAVTFTTDDGKPASGLMVTSNLKSLPPGWSSNTSGGFACGSVSTGNGCQLHLTYAPIALASGTLTLNYAYTDAAGTARTALLNIGYAATTDDNVVGTASPSGQINAVVADGGQAGNGTQAVSVTFTTDDGRPATALTLTTDLAALPIGWTGPGSFTCSGLDPENVCRLPLSYAPTAASSGTLMLAYQYSNNDDVLKTGSVAIPYRATTNDNVVATPSLSSLTTRTGSSTGVSIAFTTDDGNPATSLSVTGLASLPAGWSSTSNTFGCAAVSAGTGCVLPLTYTPTTAVTASTLTLGYSYVNDAGYPGTGTATITYGAITPYLYVTNAASNTVTSCALNFDNAVLSCTANAGFDQPSGIALSNRYAYVANTHGNSVSVCTLGSGGTLGACIAAGGFTSPTAITVNASGTFVYVNESSGVTVCSISAANGLLSSCIATGTAADPVSGVALSADAAHAFSAHAVIDLMNPANDTNVIDVCNVGADGTFGVCTASAAAAPLAFATLTTFNGTLYAAATGSLYACPIGAASALGSCQTTAAGATATGLAFVGAAAGTTAYLSSGAATVLACPVNPDGTFGTCAAHGDASFNGTAGMAIR